MRRRHAAVLLGLAVGLCGALAACQGSGRIKVDPPRQTSPQTRQQAKDTAERAFAAAERGHTDRAIELYREALSYDRDLAHAWNNLGVLYMERKRYPEAINAFNIAASLGPTDARPVTNIGMVWLRLGYARDAMEHFEEALGRDPEDLMALRGAILAAHLLDRATEETAERIKTAMVRERDETWFDFMQTQRARVEGRLESDRHEPGR